MPQVERFGDELELAPVVGVGSGEPPTDPQVEARRSNLRMVALALLLSGVVTLALLVKRLAGM